MGAVLDACSLDGRVALITGAAGGIGQATARAFAAAGATVALSDQPGADIATDGLSREQRGRVSVHEADVSDQGAVEHLVGAVVRTHGHIDVLAHVAGMLDARPFLETPLASWERTFAVNTRGPFLVGQAVARRMVEQGNGGRIVLVASNVARTPRLNNAAYAASKAAVVHLARCMALELAGHDITVNALCPGSTATPMLIDVQAHGDPRRLEGIVRGSIEQWRTGIPLGRLAEPEDQAAMIAFLATDAARHITGQALCVDGGQTLF
jgi:NAD(P)-dependent dehydrogenase (short-subunit alcohol dehydrogenase family)